jgi:hypothetical protein
MFPTDTRTQALGTDRRPGMQRGKLFSFVLFVCLLLPPPGASAGLAPSQVVRLWITFYGQQDTLRAAGFTTVQFRHGEPPEVWAAKTHLALHLVEYQHLGGEIVTTTLSETAATIVLAAKIHTRLGTTAQTETYHLQRQGGRWLIDRLEVTDQVPQEPDHRDDSREI